jgi:hypothetical protein
LTNENKLNRIKDQLRELQALMAKHRESSWCCPSCGHMPFDSRDSFASCLLYEQADGPCQSCISKLASVDNQYLLFLAPRGIDNGHVGE